MKITNQNYGFYIMTSGYYDTGNQLRQYELDKTAQHNQRMMEKKAAITTKEAFEAERAVKKQKFIDALGGLDFDRTPLNPVYTGSFDYENFTVRKLYFESLPGVYVTANLFVPHELRKPNPAVLMTCGHSNEGKEYPVYQQTAIDMANNQLIVLLMDPIGQGERVNYDELDENGQKIIPGCSREHTYLGERLACTGANIARYMIWDLMRAIDFLESLDIVDNKRIGMIGQSGGGTQTAYMMLLEDRLAAAMPCCYITSRYEFMKSGNQHDAEQVVWNVLPNEIDYDDLVTGFAPKPIRMGFASYDFFCIEGALKSFDNIQHVYELYGKENDVSSIITDDIHSLNTEMRQSVVNFFRKYLLHLDESFVAEKERAILTTEQIRVTHTGSVLRDLPGARHMFDLTYDYLQDVHYKPTQDYDELCSRVCRVLNISEKLASRDEIKYPRIIEDTVINGIHCRKVFFFTEENIVCTGVLMQYENTNPGTCTIYVSEDSTNHIFDNREDIEVLLQRGAVFVFDPRNSGAVKERQMSGEPPKTTYCPILGNDYRHNSNLIMLGESMYALRSFDIIRAYDLLKSYFHFQTVSIAGRGTGVIYTLTAAVVVNVKPVVFGPIVRYEDRFESRYAMCDPSEIIHGLLCQYDFPMLADIMDAEMLGS